MNDPLVGTTYDGRYRIERRIGAGGMANVYLAEDDTLGRRVAIKVLHQRYAEDSQFVERFLREASAAARLNHPNIVQVYDRGQSANTYYIAMEYVDGMTLKELVQRRQGLTEQEVLAYARQGLHALRFAHRNGIVHRDVKPHNMMVDTDGRLKIADFGIARAGADSGLTEAGSIVGTAQYLSPEQAQGHDVSATSDLYSLGVVMFEMSTGRVPFDGDSPVNVALKHVKDPVPRPSTLKAGIEQPLESIILKAMEKDPALRYASADEMLADLDRARDGSSTQAMTQVLGAVGGAGATQVTPITPIRPQPVSSRRYEQPVAPEPAWPEDRYDDEDELSSSPWRWIVPLLIVLVLVGLAAYFLLRPASGSPVPDVVGKTRAAAITALKADGFELGDTSEEFSDDKPAGVVLDQDPGGGDKAKAGTKIDLTISKGQESVSIPDVTNSPRNEALAELTAAGFKPTPRLEPSDTVDANRVTRTDPKAGTDAEPGSAVTVYLSRGPEARGVPNVVGKQLEEARSILQDDKYDFDVSDSSVPSARPIGEVVGQDPAPDADLDKGGEVKLSVASGSNTVPSVNGMSENDATQSLLDQGFKAQVETIDVDDPTQDGLVVESDPSQDTQLELGSTVTIRIGAAVADPNPDEDLQDPDAADPGVGTTPVAFDRETRPRWAVAACCGSRSTIASRYA